MMFSVHTVFFFVLLDAVSDKLNALVDILLTFLGSNEYIGITQEPDFVPPAQRILVIRDFFHKRKYMI
jgi:hypothetical protein